MFTCKHGHKRSFITMALAVLMLCMPFSQAEAPAQRVSDLDEYVTSLYGAMQAVYGNADTWTLEQRAAYDHLLIAAGYDPDSMLMVNGLPGDEDIPWHKALDSSVRGLSAKYGLTAADYDQFTARFSFNAADEAHPVWQVELQPTDPTRVEALGTYTVHVDARTGEISKLATIEDING